MIFEFSIGLPVKKKEKKMTMAVLYPVICKTKGNQN